MVAAAAKQSAWKRSGTFAVRLDRYDGDFRNVVSQLEVDSGRRPVKFANMGVVRVRPYKDFQRWWPAMETTYDDRHFYQGLVTLAEDGKLPQSILSRGDYDSVGVIDPHLKRLGMNWDSVSQLGMQRQVREIADAIRRGDDVPPLVTTRGKPADGRHRTLAAMRLGLKKAPVMEITETWIETTAPSVARHARR